MESIINNFPAGGPIYIVGDRYTGKTNLACLILCYTDRLWVLVSSFIGDRETYPLRKELVYDSSDENLSQLFKNLALRAEKKLTETCTKQGVIFDTCMQEENDIIRDFVKTCRPINTLALCVLDTNELILRPCEDEKALSSRNRKWRKKAQVAADKTVAMVKANSQYPLFFCYIQPQYREFIFHTFFDLSHHPTLTLEKFSRLMDAMRQTSCVNQTLCVTEKDVILFKLPQMLSEQT